MTTDLEWNKGGQYDTRPYDDNCEEVRWGAATQPSRSYLCLYCDVAHRENRLRVLPADQARAMRSSLCLYRSSGRLVPFYDGGV